MKDHVQVPFKIESNGKKTLFLPDCKRIKSGYCVGQRNVDQVNQINDYWTALSLLRQQNTPRFRRANSNGNFGTVTCEPNDLEWISKSLIEEMRTKVGG